MFKKTITLSFGSILLLGLVSLCLLTGCCTQTTKNLNSKEPEFLAHRGYSALYPESTMIAFKKALETGITGLELDVHQTSDEKIVVIHDSSVDRTTNGEGEISKLSSDYIQELTVEKNGKIPFLKDVIKFAKNENNMPVWIEIKDSYKYPSIANNIFSILKENKYEKNTIIQSFDLNDLNIIYNLDKNIRLLKLYAYNIKYDFNELPGHIDYIGLPLGIGMLRPSLIEKAHKQGLKVIFWREIEILENDTIINCLTNKGADGFMINRPVGLFKNY